MADSLFFDGVDDFITFSAGNFLGGARNTTYAVVMKLATDAATFEPIVGLNAIDGPFVTDNANPRHMQWFPGGGSASSSVFTIPATDGWCIYAITVVDSTGVVRCHKYVFSTDTWTHSDADNTASVSSPAASLIHIAKNQGGGPLFVDANYLIAGVWDAVLDDATVETLEPGYAAWVNATPKELWRFNSTSAITPTVGNSAQVARTGTTLDTGDAPATWDDSLYEIAWTVG